MTARTELDPRRLDELERDLLASASVRVGAEDLWRMLARVFPHRAPRPAERRLLLDALRVLEGRGSIRLPPEHGQRWDRSMDPAVPASVDLIRDPSGLSSFAWRSFPWHSHLHWVVQCRSLSRQQIEFLRRVHEGFVHGSFREPAPLRYRSLQLTGDEKQLASLATTSLFGPSRLTLDLLGCLPDALPLAWEAVGDGGRMVIFENAGPFAVARRVLGELESRPYDLVAYGGGRAALGHLRTIERKVEVIHYVGDLDHAGVDIAWNAGRCARELGLPAVLPAAELHRQMLATARSFGHARGWPAKGRCSGGELQQILEVLTPDVRGAIEALLQAGRRIPEEVLGPNELCAAWSRVGAAADEGRFSRL